MTLHAAAMAEYEKRERQQEEERQEREHQACDLALREAYRKWGFYPETAIYNRAKGWVELEFDKGAVKIALTRPGLPLERHWRVILECDQCGLPLLGPVVDDLADIGQALSDPRRAIPEEEWDDHYCAPREDQPLKEVLAEVLA